MCVCLLLYSCYILDLQNQNLALGTVVWLFQILIVGKSEKKGHFQLTNESSCTARELGFGAAILKTREFAFS